MSASVKAMALLVGLAFAGFGATVLADSRASEQSVAAINAHIVKAHIVPRYRALDTAMTALERRAAQFCGGDRSKHWGDVLQAFHDAMDAWQAVRHIRVGPVLINQREHRIHFWPGRRNATARGLRPLMSSADASIDDPETFARRSVAIQGLGALEWLLYARAGRDAFTGESGDYRCRLVRAITLNLKQMAQSILSEWLEGDDAFRNRIASPGEGNAWFDDHWAVTRELLLALRNALVEMHKQKVSRILDAPANAVRPRRAESWRSERSLRNLQANVDALNALYGDESGGLATLLETADGRTIGVSVTHALSELDRLVSAASRQYEGSMVSLLSANDGEVQLQLIHDALDDARKAIARVFDHLSVTLGFNSQDGD
ncbi:MAG: imelysin family protein [Pseudomonadota bacterium]